VQLLSFSFQFLEAPKEAGMFERSNSRIVRSDTEAGTDNQNEDDEAEVPLMPLWMAMVL
jgi:hypothetical protein